MREEFHNRSAALFEVAHGEAFATRIVHREGDYKVDFHGLVNKPKDMESGKHLELRVVCLYSGLDYRIWTLA